MSAAAVQPLSNVQKAGLACLAREAFTVAKRRGAVDDDANFDAWRYAEHGKACDCPPFGLREAQNDQYRLLAGHFLVILGNAEAAFELFIGSGPEAEERRRMAYRLAAQVGILAKTWGAQRKLTDAEAARQAWAYALKIARDKSQGRPLDTLTARELRNVGFTILNRRSAHAGVGKAENRNKSQRIGKPSASPSPECSNRLPSVNFGRGPITSSSPVSG